MKKLLLLFAVIVSVFFCEAQTNKDIQGIWGVVSTKITMPSGIFAMDSSTHTLTKIITPGRFIVTIYDKKTNGLIMTSMHFEDGL